MYSGLQGAPDYVGAGFPGIRYIDKYKISVGYS